MKKAFVFLIPVLFCVFSACGIPEEDYQSAIQEATAWQEKYDSASRENTSLQNDNSGLQNELNENKTNNSNLQKEIDSYKKENDSYKKDIDANKKEIDDLKKEIESLNTILGDWTKYDETERQSQIEIAKHKDDISKLQKDIDGLGKDKERLQSEINDAKSQIEKLKGEAFALAGTPKNYPAGHLYAGTDFVIGRYRIYGGSSNFVVYSSSGRLRVNIILGGRYGVDEYIYDFDDGDKIEASSSFTMVMVQ